MMPKLVYPLAVAGSLISAKIISGPTAETQPGVSDASAEIAPEVKAFRDVMVLYGIGAASEFKDFLGTPISSGDDSISYNSILRVPGASSTHIDYKKKGEISVYSSFDVKSEQEAETVYIKYKRLLQASYPNKPILEAKSDNLTRATMHVTSTLDAELILFSRTSADDPSVALRFDLVRF
jgi:hypothetical protein